MLFKKKEKEVEKVEVVEEVTQEKKNLGLKGICGIIFGLFFILSGLIYFETMPFQSILIFIAGLALIPAINRWLKKTFDSKDSMYGFTKTLFIFIAFVSFLMGVPTEDNVEVSSDIVLENKVVEKIVYTTDDALLNNTIKEKSLLENVVLEKDNKILELENTVLTRDIKITELENVISNTTVKVEELEDEVSNKTEKVTELEKSVNTLTDEKNNIQNKLNDAEKKLSSAATSKSTSITTKKSTSSTSTTKLSTSTNNSYTVYITNTGEKYHRSGCRYLKSSNPISKSDAIARGYSACKVCNP